MCVGGGGGDGLIDGLGGLGWGGVVHGVRRMKGPCGGSWVRLACEILAGSSEKYVESEEVWHG